MIRFSAVWLAPLLAWAACSVASGRLLVTADAAGGGRSLLQDCETIAFWCVALMYHHDLMECCNGKASADLAQDTQPQ